MESSRYDRKVGQSFDTHRRKVLSLVEARTKQEEESIQKIDNFISLQEELLHTSTRSLLKFIETFFHGREKNIKESNQDEGTIPLISKMWNKISSTDEENNSGDNTVTIKKGLVNKKTNEEMNYLRFLSEFRGPFCRTKEDEDSGNRHKKRRRTNISENDAPFVAGEREINEAEGIERKQNDIIPSLVIDWEPVINSDYTIKITVLIPRMLKEKTEKCEDSESSSCLYSEYKFLNLTVSSPKCSIDCQSPSNIVSSSNDHSTVKDHVKNKENSPFYYQKLETIVSLDPHTIFHANNQNSDASTTFGRQDYFAFSDPTCPFIDSRTVLDLTVGGLYINRKQTSKFVRHVIFGQISIDLIDLLDFGDKVNHTFKRKNKIKSNAKFYPEYLDLELTSISPHLTSRKGMENIDNNSKGEIDINWSIYTEELIAFFEKVNEDRTCNTKFFFHVLSSPTSYQSLVPFSTVKVQSLSSSMRLRVRLYGSDPISLYLGGRLLRKKVDSLQIPTKTWIKICVLEKFSAHVKQFWKTLSLLKQETLLLSDNVKRIILNVRKKHIATRERSINQKDLSKKEKINEKTNSTDLSPGDKDRMRTDDDITLHLQSEEQERLNDDVSLTDIVSISRKVDKSLIFLFDTIHPLQN